MLGHRGRMAGLATIVLAVLPLTSACAGGSDAPAAAQASPSQPTSGVTSVDAIVGQYARIVAESRKDVQVKIDQLSGCVAGPRPALCDQTMSTVGRQARTLAGRLQSASTTGQLAPPPQSIAVLVQETQTAADEVAATGEAFTACSGKCTKPFMQAWLATGELNRHLDAWDPYL